jgi:SAM-dependent methyltransferase
MSGTYADVDRSPDPDAAVASQEVVDSWPQIRAYKHHTYGCVSDVAPILDVGCGPGLDVAALDPSKCVGLDRSTAMCGTARRRGPAIVNADATTLPFPDDAFGAVRADRVLQHLEHPLVALGEMLRVCRPGGTVVVADPDQQTLSISVPGVPAALTDRLAALRRDVGYRNGRLVASLPETFRSLGLRRVTVDAFPLELDRADQAFGLPGWPRLWRDRGPFSDAEIEAFERVIGVAPIVYAVTYFVVTGTAPG